MADRDKCTVLSTGHGSDPGRSHTREIHRGSKQKTTSTQDRPASPVQPAMRTRARRKLAFYSRVPSSERRAPARCGLGFFVLVFFSSSSLFSARLQPSHFGRAVPVAWAAPTTDASTSRPRHMARRIRKKNKKKTTSKKEKPTKRRHSSSLFRYLVSRLNYSIPIRRRLSPNRWRWPGSPRAAFLLNGAKKIFFFRIVSSTIFVLLKLSIIPFYKLLSSVENGSAGIKG